MDDKNIEPLIDQKAKEISRRDLLGTLGFGTLSALFVPAIATPAFARGGGAMRVSFRNAHTGDSFSGTYRVGDKYLPGAFDRINVTLRDFRTGEVFPIDPRTIDILAHVQRRVGTNKPLEIISGYRSPKTNAMLRRTSTGVARKSLHMTGQAIDFRLPGYSTRRLSKHAQSLKAGGVGFYPKSNFIHVDTGKVRSW